MVAHLTGGQGVAGSNPVNPTNKRCGLDCGPADGRRFKSCQPDQMVVVKTCDLREGMVEFRDGFLVSCLGTQSDG